MYMHNEKKFTDLVTNEVYGEIPRDGNGIL